MPDSIDNTADTIDSRDVIARIEELREMREDAPDDFGKDEAEELRTLEALAKQGEDHIPDWQYGETLIRYSYFKEYAQELADDIGAVPNNAAWPLTCIDWEQAARELKVDYTTLDFDGVEYYAR